MQSLILGAVLFNAAIVLAALGVIGDLLAGQRMHDPADLRARAAHRAAARRRRRRTTSRAPRRPASEPTTGARRRPSGRPRSGRRCSCEQRRHASTAEGTVTGNTYDKYGSTNPVVRRLMAGFEGTLDELFAQAAPQSLLDVGCGEGVLTHQWAQRLGDAARRRHRPRGPDAPGRVGEAPAPNLEYRVMKAENLPFADGEFDAGHARSRCSSTCPTPSTRVAEMARVRRAPPARLGAARAAVARR